MGTKVRHPVKATPCDLLLPTCPQLCWPCSNCPAFTLPLLYSLLMQEKSIIWQMLIVQYQISIFTYLSTTVIDRALLQWLSSNQSFIHPALVKHRLFTQLLLAFHEVYLIQHREPRRGGGVIFTPGHIQLGGDPTACHSSPSHSHLVIKQEVI